MRFWCRVVLLVTAALVLTGCGKDADPYLREDPFTVREFQTVSSERWIGNAISYGPHRDGQRPGGSEPSAAEIREDLALMLPHWNLLRVYGSRGFAETLLQIIRDDKLDMKVVLGAWIGPDDLEGNRAEVDNAIRLANEYPGIVIALSVGNETQIYWSGHKSSLDILLTNVRRARAGVSIPITTADDFNWWNKEESRLIAAEVDFIMMHAHPMWNGVLLEGALPWVQEQVAAVQALHPDRTVVLGETGWATTVHDQGEQAELIKGAPGEAQQKEFYEATRSWAYASRIPVFFFEAFDENWKGGIHPNEVEKHWGLFRADRSGKMAVSSGAEQSFADSPLKPFTMAENEIRDRIRGAWVGQMIGVTWGFPTEFYARYIHQLFPDFHQRDGEPFNIYASYEGGLIPYDELPVWSPAMINGGFTQDDLYVEIPFLEALEKHGVNCGWQAYGDAFGDTAFPLYHANGAARDNLRDGLAAPASGHYANNGHADDIDWQIEADFVGLINPGQPHSAAEIAWRAGHVMNFGDGVYGGIFVAIMIATAFTAESLDEVIEAGRHSVPMGSTYRAVIEQVLSDHADGRTWEQAAQNLIDTWGTVDRCVEWAGESDPLNIDAKLNGAFILLGLLYGQGDFAETMRIAMAAGQDSDCNPSNAGSVLGAFYGYKKIALMKTDWVSALDESLTFQTTDYTLDQLVDLSLELARQVVVLKGGKAESGEPWRIPRAAGTVAPILEQWPLKENPAPELWAEAGIEEGSTVRFDARAQDEDGIRSIQWYFGDLTYATGASGIHTYRKPGTYTATCFVSDGVANTSWQQVEIVIE